MIKRFHFLLLGFAFLPAASLLHADVSAMDKDLAAEIDAVNYVETAPKGIVLSGYVDAGYIYNFVGRGETLPFRAFSADAAPGGQFNLYATELVMEKPLTEAVEWDAGFRADLMFGQDAGDLGQAPAGSDSLYLQQAYAQFRVPVGNGLNIAVGKYAAVVGYEAEERPDNINITTGMSALVDPSWHVGILSTYVVNDAVDVAFGVNNGASVDGLSTVGLPQSSDLIAVTGYVNLCSEAKNANLQLGGYYSFNGDPVAYTPPVPGVTMRDADVRDLNLFGNWSPQFANDKLLLAFNSSIINLEDDGSSALTQDTATYSTVALYAQYLLTDMITVGGRLEYVHMDDAQFLTGGPDISSTDLWGWTGTVGFHLVENLMLRAEYRIDFGDDVRINTVTGAPTHDTAQTVATEVVYKF
jgi:hypothetical protein